MAERFTIDIGGHRAVAEVVPEAPNLAAKFLQHTPLTTFAIHAKFAGGELISMLPFHAEPENPVLDVSRGDIAYFPDMQTLCLFYDEVTPFGEVSVFARVVEGLEEMRTAGRELLDNVTAPVEIRPLTAAEGPEEVVAIAPSALERVWTSEPEDVRRLLSTSLPPGGIWSGVFFVDMLLLWSGQVFSLLVELCRTGSGTGPVLSTVAAAHARQLADWINHWGVSDLAAYLRATASDLDEQPNELERTLDELILVVNRTQNWVDRLVPWASLDQHLPPAGDSSV